MRIIAVFSCIAVAACGTALQYTSPTTLSASAAYTCALERVGLMGYDVVTENARRRTFQAERQTARYGGRGAPDSPDRWDMLTVTVSEAGAGGQPTLSVRPASMALNYYGGQPFAKGRGNTGTTDTAKARAQDLVRACGGSLEAEAPGEG